jgi:group II intron reverse transcriptase/maturase
MNQSKMTQKQMTLAKTACDDPAHRFTNLYSLMHWDYWIRCAADAVLARPGSSTAGVDGITRYKLNENYEAEIEKLVESLKRKTYEPQPVRRTYIPKKNGKMRPLGIPILRDRIVQEALRAILDPIYESDFQPHSYGFRKGRCTMDAIAVIMNLFGPSLKYYYVIEGDIESYFDTVHHRKLLSILKQRIADKDIIDLIAKFLKAGVMENGLFAKTEAGVPQGGIISPLLANIYLNEFDKWAEMKWNIPQYERQKIRQAGKGNYKMIRYADDFVVVSNDGIAGVLQVKQEIKQFLETELHLKLSDEKTKVTHVNDGFEFLGFHIQRYKPEGRWVMYLRPSQKARERIKAKLKDLTSRRWTWMDEYTRLMTLNRIIKGWAEYYKHTSLIHDIDEISRFLWFRYLAFLLKKHKGSRKQQLISEKTKVIHNRTRWTATVRQGDKTLEVYQWQPTRKEYKRTRYLQKGRDGFPHPYIFEGEPTFADFPNGEIGPDEHIYTENIGILSGKEFRNEPLEMQELKLKAKLRDGFKCVRCGGTENIHVHHIKGMKSHQLEDLETLCRKCHHAEHGYRQKNQPNGEPDEAKVSCPVREEG